MKPRRAAAPRERMKAVLVYFPEEMVRWIDSAARTEDTDRSKFVRKAVRDFLEKHSRAA